MEVVREMTISDDDMRQMDRRAANLARLADETPPFIDTALGIWCSIHGVYDCPEPFCWRCGNHLISANGRCVDPGCQATNTAEVTALVNAIGRDAPRELLAYEVGRMLSDGWHSVAAEPDKGSGHARPAPPSSEVE